MEVRSDAPLFTRPSGLPARNPNVTLRELMAAIGHTSPVAALRYQHATAERSKPIASYAVSGGDSEHGAFVIKANHQDEQQEAAGGIEPPYGALQGQRWGSQQFS